MVDDKESNAKVFGNLKLHIEMFSDPLIVDTENNLRLSKIESQTNKN